jgi:uncharacterized protein (DUF1778 family)
MAAYKGHLKRLTPWVRPDTLLMVQHAAELEQRSVSSWCDLVLRKAAKAAVKRQDRKQLNAAVNNLYDNLYEKFVQDGGSISPSQSSS